jgi:hypothetical protein
LALLLGLAAVGCGGPSGKAAPDSSSQDHSDAVTSQPLPDRQPSGTTGDAPNRQPSGNAGDAPNQQAKGAPGQKPKQEAGGAPGPKPDQQGGAGNGAAGAPGAPGDKGNGATAAGAPIRIPSIVQDQGRPLDEVRAEIEQGIADQCKGEKPCPTLEETASDPGFTKCQFVRTEPPQGTEVPRDSTVVIVAGSQPCETESGGGGTPPEGGGPPTEGSGPPEEGQAPPSTP